MREKMRENKTVQRQVSNPRLMVRSAAQPRVSNHESVAMRAIILRDARCAGSSG
jgi:hypothetical protein